MLYFSILKEVETVHLVPHLLVGIFQEIITMHSGMKLYTAIQQVASMQHSVVMHFTLIPLAIRILLLEFLV